jgi:hypothetical protein
VGSRDEEVEQGVKRFAGSRASEQASREWASIQSRAKTEAQAKNHKFWRAQLADLFECAKTRFVDGHASQWLPLRYLFLWQQRRLYRLCLDCFRQGAASLRDVGDLSHDLRERVIQSFLVSDAVPLLDAYSVSFMSFLGAVAIAATVAYALSSYFLRSGSSEK